jgi:hypothetical protein
MITNIFDDVHTSYFEISIDKSLHTFFHTYKKNDSKRKLRHNLFDLIKFADRIKSLNRNKKPYLIGRIKLK